MRSDDQDTKERDALVRKVAAWFGGDAPEIAGLSTGCLRELAEAIEGSDPDPYFSGDDWRELREDLRRHGL